MTVVTTAVLAKSAAAAGRATPAFNIDNMESAMAVANLVKQTKQSVIFQMIPRTLKYGGVATYPAMIFALLADEPTEVAIHLDHGNDFEMIKQAIDCGFSSVMIDGSALPFFENVALTKMVAEYAHEKGVSVEGELGAIGGKEEGDVDLEASYTKVSEAVEFVEKTGVDLLAIGVGTAHGIYKGEPHINVKRIEEIKNAVNTYLVLHGASGLSKQILEDSIKAGVRKINFATELRQAFTDGLKEGLKLLPDAFDPKLYLPYAVKKIEAVAKSKLDMCSLNNRL